MGYMGKAVYGLTKIMLSDGSVSLKIDIASGI
jgi:hypothetical protein